MGQELNKRMAAAFFSSDMFAEPCGVAITSLFESNTDFEAIDVYLIEDHISAENRARFGRLAERYQRSIHMIPMPEPQAFFHDSRFTIKALGHTYAHLIVGQLLPQEVGRVLCLDSDMLVVDSLMELWNTDMAGCYVAGVDTGAGELMMKNYLGVPPGRLFCNGGLFLMDLRRIREDGIEEKYRQYISGVFDAGHSLASYEEEVINKCCWPRVLRLDARYNLMSVNLVMDYKEFIRFRGAVNYYTEEEMRRAIEHPAIVHAINTFYVKKRFWEKGSDSPWADTYQQYREKSPWSGLPQMETKYTLKQRAMKEVWHLVPRKASLFAARLVRNYIRPRMARNRDDE